LHGEPPSLEYCAKCLGVSVESLKKKACPKCGKPFEVVAYGKDYYIVGCMEHREFDKVY
jgi:Zn finger protein HypA/HybF involved in hydrogenase expression